jgi:hypothetical protein
MEVCICGHPGEDHNYTPDGCGTTECLWSEGTDEYGLPTGQRCAAKCAEYLTEEDVS